MSTTKPRSPSDPLHPEAPAELLARREPLLASLDKAAKGSRGLIQDVVLKVMALVNSTRPGTPIEPQVFQEVQEAFLRMAESKTVLPVPIPPVVMQAMEWIQGYFAARGFLKPGEESEAALQAASATPTAAPVTATSAAPKVAGKGKDGFESGASQRTLTLSGDEPVTPGTEPPAKNEKPGMESFKNWTKNPSYGKVKG